MYTGFGNEDSCVIYGHAFSLSPMPRKTYRNFFLYNSIALLRLFMVKTKAGAKVKLFWNDTEYETTTEDDGFFKFEWKPAEKLAPGTYKVTAVLMKRGSATNTISFAEAEVIVPTPTTYAFISDIDDTFLISHSSNLRKRLFVLLTENARSRRPFDGAVNHYRLLHGIDDEEKANNAFFYVSSSEWNLYNYIREFIRRNELPEGVLLLNQVKTFSKVFATGQNNHNGKFFRIVRIIEAYPHQKFVLLGDDSQKDIDIYSSIVEHFPDSIYCVYIRRVYTPEKPHVREKQKDIEKAGVQFFYFAHSEDAIKHSMEIGLINKHKAIENQSDRK
ncbi:MAG: phosphatase domain-containing protein [Bacteroidota bacterium]